MFSFFAGDVACGEVFHFAVFDGDEVAAVGEVGWTEGDSHADRFKGAAAGVVCVRVVAEY